MLLVATHEPCAVVWGPKGGPWSEKVSLPRKMPSAVSVGVMNSDAAGNPKAQAERATPSGQIWIALPNHDPTAG